jgi:dTDP-4-dehydrorhamnose reductase
MQLNERNYIQKRNITMKILVIGANGQLGRALCSKAETQDLDIEPLDFPEFDITEAPLKSRW